MFGKKKLKKMLMRKVWDHMIDVKEEFVLRKEKIYLLLREEREKIRKFIKKQIRKEYIQPLKSPQTAPVFFVRKKNEKKRIV